VEAINKIISFIRDINRLGVEIEYLNIGGGLGIIYKGERPQTAQEFAKAIIPLLKPLRQKIILEPGRFIVGNSGILVTKVLYLKMGPVKKFVIVDGGMNDLIRPSLYDAYHQILPVVQPRQKRRESVDIVGPICESGDFFAKDRKIPLLKSNDLLAVMGTGAYGFSMSSNYNARRRVAEVMVIKNKFYVVRKRETYPDLIKGEGAPEIL
jgi:diaminopimelate decarboxylase